MTDYKAMYLSLFNTLTHVIGLLQQAQQAAEAIYLEGEDEPAQV